MKIKVLASSVLIILATVLYSDCGKNDLPTTPLSHPSTTGTDNQTNSQTTNMGVNQSTNTPPPPPPPSNPPVTIQLVPMPPPN